MDAMKGACSSGRCCSKCSLGRQSCMTAPAVFLTIRSNGRPPKARYRSHWLKVTFHIVWCHACPPQRSDCSVLRLIIPGYDGAAGSGSIREDAKGLQEGVRRSLHVFVLARHVAGSQLCPANTDRDLVASLSFSGPDKTSQMVHVMPDMQGSSDIKSLSYGQ